MRIPSYVSLVTQGLPRNNQRVPPTMPRRGSGVPSKRPIPNVKKVLGRRARVGLLDLDIYGPSIPKLMHLEDMGEPELSKRTWKVNTRGCTHSHDQLFRPLHVYGLPSASGHVRL